MHPLARTTPVVRLKIVAEVAAGTPVAEAARRFGVSRQTIYKWLRRHDEGGEAALLDRRPIARSFPSRISKQLERRIGQLRRSHRLLGWQIAQALCLARSTVIKVLKRLGMSRLKDLDPPLITKRYEYRRPGELVHIDIKKLGRFYKVGHRIHGDRTIRSEGAGYDVLYVAVDDCSRTGSVRRYDAEDATSAAGFLRRVILEYQRRGVRIERVMTDNGKVFTSIAFQAVLAEFGIRHILTPFYTPRWNGKAERFIQTLLREWAYAIAYRSSEERLAALSAWLRYYNQDRQHTALNYLTPAKTWRAAL
jgi:transposase InsO family protein